MCGNVKKLCFSAWILIFYVIMIWLAYATGAKGDVTVKMTNGEAEVQSYYHDLSL